MEPTDAANFSKIKCNIICSINKEDVVLTKLIASEFDEFLY